MNLHASRRAIRAYRRNGFLTANGRAADGYAMAVLLVGIAIMGIFLGVAMPVWHQTMQREKEEELIFRGNQYARAVGLFQRKNGNAYPPSLDVLVQQKYLRKKYKDPMVEDGVFQLIPAGTAGQAGVTNLSINTNQPLPITTQQSGTSLGGARVGAGTQTVVTAIAGVVSKSTDKSIRLYNGRDHYNEWVFTYQGNVGRRGVIVPGGGRGGRGQGPGQGPGTVFPPGGRGRGPGRGGQ